MKLSNSTGSKRQQSAKGMEIVLGLCGLMTSVKQPRPKPTCTQCGCKLPPGRPGRECKTCRTK